MEVVEMLKGINNKLGAILSTEWIHNVTLRVHENQVFVLVVGFVVVSLALGIVLAIIRKWKNQGSSAMAIVAEFLPEVKEFVGVGSTRPRFRKRDKVLFYGRKMLRKGNQHTSVHGTFQRIDVSLCSRVLVPLLRWDVQDDFRDSDHFPIFTLLKQESIEAPPQ